VTYSMMYLKTENVHLIKDMGMIPFKLHKLYGVDAAVVTYENDNYSYIEKEVQGLKLSFVKKIFNNQCLDGALYLMKNADGIDILQIFHCTLSSVVFTYIYKTFNRKGKVYLKLDCSHKLLERIRKLSKLSAAMLYKFLQRVDLISVEQEKLFLELKNMLPDFHNKLIKVPNGIDYDYLENLGVSYKYTLKENIILNVARIGAEEKNTLMLLEAFARIKDIEKSNWSLRLIGKVDSSFQVEIDNYFARYPHLRKKVVFTGAIIDREELYKEYQKSKIFSLTSNFESFGIAFIEAAALGNIIVSTDVGIAAELVEKENGEVVSVGDVEGLKEALERFLNKNNLEELCSSSYKICKNKFNWNTIIEKLYRRIVTEY
jgi:L-malate glycosyltransferase